VFVCQWLEGKLKKLCRGVQGRCVEKKVISGVGVAAKESRAEELLCSHVSLLEGKRRYCVEVLEKGVPGAVALKESQSEKRRSN
jgi:hypothetical protein